MTRLVEQRGTSGQSRPGEVRTDATTGGSGNGDVERVLDNRLVEQRACERSVETRRGTHERNQRLVEQWGTSSGSSTTGWSSSELASDQSRPGEVRTDATTAGRAARNERSVETPRRTSS